MIISTRWDTTPDKDLLQKRYKSVKKEKRAKAKSGGHDRRKVKR